MNVINNFLLRSALNLTIKGPLVKNNILSPGFVLTRNKYVRYAMRHLYLHQEEYITIVTNVGFAPSKGLVWLEM